MFLVGYRGPENVDVVCHQFATFTLVDPARITTQRDTESIAVAQNDERHMRLRMQWQQRLNTFQRHVAGDCGAGLPWWN